jgi:hypothetical protein
MQISFRQNQHSSIQLFQYPTALNHGKACGLWRGPKEQVFNIRIK